MYLEIIETIRTEFSKLARDLGKDIKVSRWSKGKQDRLYVTLAGRYLKFQAGYIDLNKITYTRVEYATFLESCTEKEIEIETAFKNIIVQIKQLSSQEQTETTEQAETIEPIEPIEQIESIEPIEQRKTPEEIFEEYYDDIRREFGYPIKEEIETSVSYDAKTKRFYIYCTELEDYSYLKHYCAGYVSLTEEKNRRLVNLDDHFNRYIENVLEYFEGMPRYTETAELLQFLSDNENSDETLSFLQMLEKD